VVKGVDKIGIKPETLRRRHGFVDNYSVLVQLVQKTETGGAR